MLKLLTGALLALALATPALAQAPAPAAPDTRPVEVMVLGSWHMDNPGRDINNVRSDPVTTPRRQAEMARVADALSRFRPTAVAIERVAPDTATLADPGFVRFRAADLLSNNDERVQVGYRLAARAGVSRVYAIDEQPRPGGRDYFPCGPMQEWAAAHGQAEALTALRGPVQAEMQAMQARQQTESIGQLLAYVNSEDSPLFGARGQGGYYNFLRFGDGGAQPGAELNAAWYERNAKIFTKLMQVARPGDRIVVLFGAGHAYWLRHFVATTPGFRLVEPNDYLRDAG